MQICLPSKGNSSSRLCFVPLLHEKQILQLYTQHFLNDLCKLQCPSSSIFFLKTSLFFYRIDGIRITFPINLVFHVQNKQKPLSFIVLWHLNDILIFACVKKKKKKPLEKLLLGFFVAFAYILRGPYLSANQSLGLWGFFLFHKQVCGAHAAGHKMVAPK